ncbi:MAG: hypothetical protein ACN6O7_02680 [Sphingobacterium sp.]
MKTQNNKKLVFAIALSLLALGSCKKDEENAPPREEGPKESFIPRTNVKYTYSIIEEDLNIGTAIKWINGGKDSAGISVYNLHTNIQAYGYDMALDNRLYVANDRTYTDFNMPDAWYVFIEGLKNMPNTTLEKAETKGFPGYMVLENAIRENSKLTWEVPDVTGQYIKYKQKQADKTITYEMSQEIKQFPGLVTAVEKITVPAGTFTCAKFVYKTSQSQSIKIDGSNKGTKTGTETVSLWMAHGIGVVKQENETVFAGTTSKTAIVLNNISK